MAKFGISLQRFRVLVILFFQVVFFLNVYKLNMFSMVEKKLIKAYLSTHKLRIFSYSHGSIFCRLVSLDSGFGCLDGNNLIFFQFLYYTFSGLTYTFFLEKSRQTPFVVTAPTELDSGYSLKYGDTVRPRFWNPCPISNQNIIQFSLPDFRPVPKTNAVEPR